MPEILSQYFFDLNKLYKVIYVLMCKHLFLGLKLVAIKNKNLESDLL